MKMECPNCGNEMSEHLYADNPPYVFVYWECKDCGYTEDAEEPEKDESET